MKFHIMTLFPDMIKNGLSESITGRAIDKNLIELNVVNIRDFANNKYNHVDDYTYGGGAGMLIQAEPVYCAYKSICSDDSKKKPAARTHCPLSADGSHRDALSLRILQRNLLRRRNWLFSVAIMRE